MATLNLTASSYGTIERLTPVDLNPATYQLSPFLTEPSAQGYGLAMPPDFIENNVVARGVLLFDTSSIPVGAIIDSAKFYRKFLSTPLGAEDYIFQYHLGNFPLEGTEAVFNAGELCATEQGASFTDGIEITLDVTGKSVIIAGGTTALKWSNPYNESYPDDPANSNGAASLDSALCELRIVWSKPPRGKWPFMARAE